MLKHFWKTEGRNSFSQTGEDLIIWSLCKILDLRQPRYLDIGAHDPVTYSNTCFFYRRGCRGVLVEPNPELCKKIARRRSRDLCINAGAGPVSKDQADYYMLSNSKLSTFCRATAERIAGQGRKTIVEVRQIPIIGINDLLANHCQGPVDLVSLDVEGLDESIVRAWDFARFRPRILCIETVNFTEDNTEEKAEALIAHVCKQGYRVFADTYINTIFVSEQSWRDR